MSSKNSSLNATILTFPVSSLKAASIAFYASGALFIALALISITLLFFIFHKHRSLINNSVNIFVLNVVAIDLAKALLQQPVFLYSVGSILLAETSDLFQKSSNNQNGSATVLCGINASLNLVFEVAQMLSFVAISYERYKIVLSPLLNQTKRLVLAKRLLALIWCVALSVMITLTLAVFLAMSGENVGCAIDVFHYHAQKNVAVMHKNGANFTYIKSSSNLAFYNSSRAWKRNLQNWSFDAFLLVFTAVSLLITGYFYARIILFLKLHEENMAKKLSIGVGNSVRPKENHISLIQDEKVQKPRYFSIN
jgi:hypothetical protein